jgi:hypothetical protein
LENQTILASFIQKPVIKFINKSLVHIIALMPTVTTRPGKYRTIAQTNPLWSLSSNKVSSCH